MQRSNLFWKNRLFTPTYGFRTSTSYAAAKKDVELKSWKEIPGPSSLPLIGPLRHFVAGGCLYQHTGSKLTQKLYQTYGDIVRLDALPGLKPTIFLFEPESVSKILRGENTLPVRPGLERLKYYRKTNKRLFGLLADGEPWKELRTTVNPIVLMPKTIKLYAGELDTVALDMVERIRKIRYDENKIQNKLLQEINLWALESIGTVTLGCRMGCLEPNLPEDSPASKMVKCSRALSAITFKLDLQPHIWKYIPTQTLNNAMKNYEEQEKLCKYFINKSIKKLKDNPRSDDEKGVLEKLMEIDEDKANTLSSDILTGGLDTAAYTMIATLYLLAVNPEKQHKLREELESGQSAYLKACLKESLRVMPVSIGNGRVITKECNVLGYKIPTGVNAIFVHQDMSVMEKHFMKSKEYIPERWLVDSTDPLCYKNAHPFAYMPFGFGVRSCIGRRIVELQLESLLTRAVENFHWEWNGPPPKIYAGPTNVMEEPYNFKIHDLKK